MALGVSSTHEKVYQLGTRHQDWPEHDHVEVSWAAPKYRDIWPADVTVFHLVRHPLRVCESYLNVMKGGATRWYQQHWKLPDMLPAAQVQWSDGAEWTDNDWCAWHYISWNRWVERYAESRWKVEEALGPGATVFSCVTGHLGAPRPQEAIVEAAKKANRNSVNAGKHVVTLDDLCEELRVPMERIIADYGYSTQDTNHSD